MDELEGEVEEGPGRGMGGVKGSVLMVKKWGWGEGTYVWAAVAQLVCTGVQQ